MGNTQSFLVKDYDLDATLPRDRPFRWKQVDGSWFGVIAPTGFDCAQVLLIMAETESDFRLELADPYLQLDVDLHKSC